MLSDARHALRAATCDLHARVDQAFARFDLSAAPGYACALLAHWAATPVIERAVDAATAWSGWSPRWPLLNDDLAELGLEQSLPPAAPVLTGPAGWGAQYVMEGSRLGGRVLVGGVGARLPRRYFTAPARGGGWRGFQAELQGAAEAGGKAWLEEAIEAARRAFGVFERAAERELETAGER